MSPLLLWRYCPAAAVKVLPCCCTGRASAPAAELPRGSRWHSAVELLRSNPGPVHLSRSQFWYTRAGKEPLDIN